MRIQTRTRGSSIPCNIAAFKLELGFARKVASAASPTCKCTYDWSKSAYVYFSQSWANVARPCFLLKEEKTQLVGNLEVPTSLH